MLTSLWFFFGVVLPWVLGVLAVAGVVLAIVGFVLLVRALRALGVDDVLRK